MDHHQAQAVEQRDARQHQRVGVRREPAHREVRHGEQGQVGQRRRQSSERRELVLLVGLDEHRARAVTSTAANASSTSSMPRPRGQRGSRRRRGVRRWAPVAARPPSALPAVTARRDDAVAWADVGSGVSTVGGRRRVRVGRLPGRTPGAAAGSGGTAAASVSAGPAPRPAWPARRRGRAASMRSRSSVHHALGAVEAAVGGDDAVLDRVARRSR